jgi:hypothetical protein
MPPCAWSANACHASQRARPARPGRRANRFAALRGAFPKIAFVLTTTNLRAFKDLVGADTIDAIGLIELFGKPFDLAQVSRAVRRALGHPAAAALPTTAQGDSTKHT